MNCLFHRTGFLSALALALGLGVSVLLWAEPSPAQQTPPPGPGGPGGPRSPKPGGAEKPFNGEAPRPGPPRGFAPGEGGHPPFAGLSEEENRRVREVLAKVWQDPAVMTAKESVRVSTEEYRDALKEAVIRVDPEVARLMNRFYEGSRSAEMRERFDEHLSRGDGRPGSPGMRPQGPGMHPGAGFMWDLPEFVRALDPEKREIYLAAREKAEASEKVAGLKKEMGALEQRERVSREERFELLSRMRRVMREEMVRIDPRVQEFVPDHLKSPPGGEGRPDRPQAADREPGSAGEQIQERPAGKN